MPNRYIRESAIESEGVNSLSWQAEVFYRRLLNRVDDFGRYTAVPALLRATIFPLQLDKVREVDIPRLLTECETAGLLFRYTADAKATLIVNRWEQGRAKESKYPPPPADVCERMKTYVYGCQHMSPTPTPTPITDSDNGAGAPGVVFPDGLKTPEFAAKWAEYVAYRIAARFKPLKPQSVVKQLAEMAAWGQPAAMASIDQTIRNGWQGLFAPKAGFVPPPPPTVTSTPANLR